MKMVQSRKAQCRAFRRSRSEVGRSRPGGREMGERPQACPIWTSQPRRSSARTSAAWRCFGWSTRDRTISGSSISIAKRRVVGGGDELSGRGRARTSCSNSRWLAPDAAVSRLLERAHAVRSFVKMELSASRRRHQCAARSRCTHRTLTNRSIDARAECAMCAFVAGKTLDFACCDALATQRCRGCGLAFRCCCSRCSYSSESHAQQPGARLRRARCAAPRPSSRCRPPSPCRLSLEQASASSAGIRPGVRLAGKKGRPRTARTASSKIARSTTSPIRNGRCPRCSRSSSLAKILEG